MAKATMGREIALSHISWERWMVFILVVCTVNLFLSVLRQDYKVILIDFLSTLSESQSDVALMLMSDNIIYG